MIINYDVSALLAQLANIDFAHAQNVATPGENLDDYTTGGIYYFSSANEPVGKPEGTSAFGFLIVINGASSSSASVARLVQIWINTAISANTMWMRSNSTTSLSWGDWKRFVTNEDFKTKEITPTLVSTLPTGVTAVSKIVVVQSGNVVSVSLDITRDSTALTSYQAIASGLPTPKVRPMSGSISIPLGQISAASSTAGRPLNVIVSNSGNLAVSSGGIAAQYLGTFTYITDDI